ncbi:MAG: hypothetical protein F6J98_08410 [Moorea sp. SIO4G2]|uniref:hypothetical protein n=1 Tax=Moorena TaxID=1155738 RepID=UPI001300EAE6|nr:MULTISPECIES: hypothetical protein [Moorena]NEO11488.1 hypothetical protein [Moorena sp. SIO3E8]NEO60448.1 hypothetical protein [Moorena sp. SIO4G2]NEP97948.1 hypothetical protein [Moorena sp. SIO3F7]
MVEIISGLGRCDAPLEPLRERILPSCFAQLFCPVVLPTCLTTAVVGLVAQSAYLGKK